jgi:benzylsuccinate CoA-transferase BbsF subunit
MALLQEHGVPAGVVQDARDLYEDPQLRHRGHYQMRPHAEMGEIPLEMPAIRFSATPVRLDRPAPLLGEHNDHVFRDLLGYPQDEFDHLIAEGIIEYYEGA